MSGWPPPGQVDRVHHGPRIQHGPAGLDRRQRGPAPHRGGPGRRSRRAPVDRQRVHADAGRSDPAGRLPRGPLRAPEGVRGGRGVVRHRLPAVRARAERGRAGRGPCPAGDRGRPADPRLARPDPGLLPPRRPGPGRRPVVRFRGHRGGRGALRRRLAGGRAGLALGVPAERAAGGGVRPGGAAARPRVPGHARPRTVRRPRGGPGRPRAGPGHVRADRGGRGLVPRGRGGRRGDRGRGGLRGGGAAAGPIR